MIFWGDRKVTYHYTLCYGARVINSIWKLGLGEEMYRIERSGQKCFVGLCLRERKRKREKEREWERESERDLHNYLFNTELIDRSYLNSPKLDK